MITVVDQVNPWLAPSSTFADRDPGPRRRPHQEQRYGCRDEPARDEDRLPSEPVRQSSGEVVRERLDDAEDDDEREDAQPAPRGGIPARPRPAGCCARAPPSRRRTR